MYRFGKQSSSFDQPSQTEDRIAQWLCYGLKAFEYVAAFIEWTNYDYGDDLVSCMMSFLVYGVVIWNMSLQCGWCS
jgi:hypothetical protein